jgi:hypothetical protein
LPKMRNPGKYQRIDVELKGLKCPICGSSDFNICFSRIKKVKNGYIFSATLGCKTTRCTWKKTLKSGFQSTKKIFSDVVRIKRIKISTDGIEIETRE